MYPHFFGFKERPFKLVPDPDYLFLSQGHEEALAHLKYAVMSGEGFVEVIGEVGTGKTLLCRVFLENLGPEIETAYIFNPAMDARHLLAAINEEFGIASHHESSTALIYELNQFLIKQKVRGRKAILLIDEAQSLSRAVLEQIRLLTNLETSKDKLLQIVLVGQPELGELLDSYELRQLAQRITLSCRLRPLTLKETEAYINHRLHVAACKPVKVFNKAAIRSIYRFCGGVPRLINIACDRSLLAAYSDNKQKVSGHIGKTVVKELSSRGDMRQAHISRGRWKLAGAGLAAVCLFVGLLLYQVQIKAGGPDWSPSEGTATSPPADGTSSVPAGMPAPSSGALSDPGMDVIDKPLSAFESRPTAEKKESVSSSGGTLEDLLCIPSGNNTRLAIAESVLSRWKRQVRTTDEFESIGSDDTYFELLSQLNGLQVHRVNGNLDLIKRLNLPAILKMQPPGDETPVFLIVVGCGKNTLTLTGARSRPALVVSNTEVHKYWSGIAYVVWKNFYHYQGILPLDTSGESVITLKMHLKDIGVPELSTNADYDARTRSAVEAIQARHGIPVDGYVGPLTKILLYNEKESLAIPHLEKEAAAEANDALQIVPSRGDNRYVGTGA